MIAGLRGKLEARTTEYAVIDVHGLSYKVFAPAPTLLQLGGIGEEVKVHTYLHVREDNMMLYGFLTEPELRMFEMLITVSGIGPRAALNILSSVSLESLRLAISTENTDLLLGVPGIGKKTAARMVLELRGKVQLAPGESSVGVVAAEDTEVVAALTALGYSNQDAQAALEALSSHRDASVEDKIVLALRYFDAKR